jgi:PAS domain S-box-containing protein
MRILIVEDDADDADLLQAYLADAGHGGAEALRARTLAEALGLLRARDVQLTLLDLDLPVSRGLHTLERVCAAAAGPVVVVSGNSHPALVEEALKRRAYDVIPKQELDAATLGRTLRLASLQQETGRVLRATEERFRALLENASEALVLLDAAGRIGYASESMRRVLGFESDEVVGRVSLEFVDPGDRGEVYAAFLRLHAAPGSKETLRVRYRHKDGSLRIMESSAARSSAIFAISPPWWSSRSASAPPSSTPRWVSRTPTTRAGCCWPTTACARCSAIRSRSWWGAGSATFPTPMIAR